MSIILKKSKFPKLKYKTKCELAKEVSLNSKIELEILLETFNKEIEEKYFNIIQDLSNRYLLQKIENNEQSDRELFDPEKGEVFIKIDKQNYIILLDLDKLKKNLFDKLIRYTNEKWNTKTISDEISYLPLVYDYILKISKLELHIDESVFFINVRKLEKVNLKEVKAPGKFVSYLRTKKNM